MTDWEIEQVIHIRNRCKSILRNPSATAEDKNIAECMIDFFKDAPLFTDAEHARMDQRRLLGLEWRANHDSR